MYIQIMLISSICLLLLVSEGASGLQCLSKKSIEDFYKSKKAITEVHTDIEEYVHKLESRTIKTLESDLKQTMENYGKRITDLVKNSVGAFKTELGSMDEKIKNLHTEYRVLGKDARMKKWIKYGGHCYYFSTGKTNWWKAQNYCKQFGGYLIKLDSNGENTLILSNINIGISYWIGLTDTKTEGEFLWTHDQSKAVSLDWYPGYGSRGRRYNCGAVDCSYGRPQPFDQICSSNSYRYICESNVC